MDERCFVEKSAPIFLVLHLDTVVSMVANPNSCSWSPNSHCWNEANVQVEGLVSLSTTTHLSMNTRRNWSVTWPHSNRCTRTECRMHRHRRYDRISMWTVQVPYESVCRPMTRSSSLRVCKIPDRSNERGRRYPAETRRRVEERREGRAERVTKTFFNLISRWTKPRPCK